MNLILTHDHADFDAVASQLALAQLMPEARAVLPTHLNRNVRAFLHLYSDVLPFIEHKDIPKRHVDRAWLVDTQTLQLVRGMDKHTLVEVIDHHARRDDLPADWTASIDTTGANTTPLIEKMRAAGINLTPIEATLLALGIYEDTGALSYGTTTPRDISAAAWLLEQGAVLDTVRGFLHHPLADDQRELYEALLENMETVTIDGHAVVIASAKAKGMVEEISVVAHKLRDLLDPAAIFLLVDLGSHLQMVARSSAESVDVGQVADELGGGGHNRAAAAVIRGMTLDEARSKLLEIVPRIIKPSVTVADLMSKGVLTIAHDARIDEAAALMRRYGYEGLPVVSDGKITGLVTRRAVDRAIDHRLPHHPVQEIMEAGEVAVSPTESLATVQRIMMTTGWGQIPVLEEGQIVGVVTRTDVIKRMGVLHERPSRRAEIVRRMDQALHPLLMAVVREVGRIAESQGLHLYVVGGFVRDLLLGLPTGDMDFVVEGDAIALTKAVQRKFGGAIRAHGRFGTGKWMLNQGDWERIAHHLGGLTNPSPGASHRPPPEGEVETPTRSWTDLPHEGDLERLPAHLDFVTARTEFYNAPTALPDVERSSIKLDIHRRDFTINTLAISLDPQSFGELLDFYGGEADLKEGRIRVLHSLSFVDDPTRILRAVRLEQRLGFHIGPRTLDLIQRAIPLLDRVSGDRIRHEIEFVFDEAAPEKPICRMAELGVLQALHPELICDEWVLSAFESLRKAHEEPVWPEIGEGFDLELAYFAVLTYRMEDGALRVLCNRLHVKRHTVTTLEQMHRLKDKVDELSRPQQPSRIDAVLDRSDDTVLITAWAATPNEQAQEQIAEYARTLRHVMPETDGSQLIARGLTPSPVFSHILRTLRAGRLDGTIRTGEEEEQLLEQLLMEER